MRLGVLGINYKSADLFLRERVAKACQRIFGLESSHSSAYSLVHLSTCNRTELYFSALDLAEAHSHLLTLLRDAIEIPFEHSLYSYFGAECFTHLAKVTTGLDSVIIAETEIQRQVKMAYENACIDHSLPSCMHFLFQKCLKVGKWIRSSSHLPKGRISLEGMLFQLSRHLFEEVKDASVLFVGNSEINRKILSYFRSKGIKKITLCTRSSAEDLIGSALEIVGWDELPYWQNYDLVICGTNQHDYLLTPSQLSLRPIKNRMIFDLSVPRNVDPALKKHPQINLLNIEEIGHLIEKKQSIYSQQIAEIEDLIRSSVERQMMLFSQKEQKSLVFA